jgi:hypothetical protein
MQPLLDAENPRAKIGFNNPPGPIDDAREVYRAIAAFMKDAPVVDSEATALAANEKLTAGRSMVKALEKVQGDEADPIYEKWKAARAKYAPVISSMSKLIDELGSRLKAFMVAEEARRKREAEIARLAAEEAKRLAIEAEAAELEARENASLGDLEADIGAAIETADVAFDEFKAANRAAKIAEKDSKVKFRSRFGDRATTLKTKKLLVLDDAAKALIAIGATDKITEAILSSAREYRKTHGTLPDGVSEIEERTL